MRALIPPRPAPADPLVARWTHVAAIDSSELRSPADLRSFFDKVVDQKAEGLMVKLLEGAGANGGGAIESGDGTGAGAGAVGANGNGNGNGSGVGEAVMVEDDDAEADAEEEEGGEGAGKKGRRKPLPATYEPDQRSMGWLKVKKDYLEGLGDSLDLVPVGAWWGTGRKAGWWSPILLAARNPESGALEAVCKCESVCGVCNYFILSFIWKWCASLPSLLPIHMLLASSLAGAPHPPFPFPSAHPCPHISHCALPSAPPIFPLPSSAPISPPSRPQPLLPSPIPPSHPCPTTRQHRKLTQGMSGFTDAFYKSLLLRYPPDSDPATCSPHPLAYVDSGGLVPDRWFAPREVWEIRGADITLSPVYPAGASYMGGERGLSLRFPRFIRVREDKGVEEATSAEEFAGMYRRQVERGGGGALGEGVVRAGSEDAAEDEDGGEGGGEGVAALEAEEDK